MGAQIEDTSKFFKFVFHHYSDKYDQLNWPNLYDAKLHAGIWHNDDIYLENYPEKVEEDVKIFLSKQDKGVYIKQYVDSLRNILQETHIELDHYEQQIT